MYRFVLSLALIVLTGCTTTITEVIEVYPTELTIVSSVSQVQVGEVLGVGANATILGKRELGVGDVVSVTVRDETVLKVVADFRGQNYCSTGGLSNAICLQRWLDLRALKSGETFIVFRVHGTADSVKVTVHPSGKG